MRDEELFDRVTGNALRKFTANTLTDRRSLELEMKNVRKNSWAMDNEEFSRGVICLAVPLFDLNNGLAGTIGMTVTTLSYDINTFQQEMLPKIKKTGQIISQHLGHNPENIANTG